MKLMAPRASLTMRQEFERRLRVELDDLEWDYLDEHGYVAEFEDAADDDERGRIISEVRELLRAFGGRKRRPQERLELDASTGPSLYSKRLWQRARAVSRLVALEAAEDNDVIRFRARFLPKGLIEPAAVSAWTEKQAHLERATLRPQGYPARRGSYESLWTRLFEDDPGLFVQIHYLHDDRYRIMSVPRKGTLARLAHLGQDLSLHYEWPRAEATAFVLSGRTPYLLPARLLARDIARPNALARVTLRVDPEVTPQELAQYWREFRRSLLAGPLRPVNERHLTLVSFAAALPSELPANELTDRWNKQHSEWQYTPSNLLRDLRRTRAALMGHRPARRMVNPRYWALFQH